MIFKKWLSESQQWEEPTSQDYRSLFIIADYMEDENNYKVWFQQFRKVVVDFSKRGDELHNRLRRFWIEESEEDPLEEIDNWLLFHLLPAIDKVLNDDIQRNGPLFSVANAIKNIYTGLSSYSNFTYFSPDQAAAGAIGLINREVQTLIADLLRFIKSIYPVFMRAAKVRWVPGERSKNTLDRLATVAKFD